MAILLQIHTLKFNPHVKADDTQIKSFLLNADKNQSPEVMQSSVRVYLR